MDNRYLKVAGFGLIGENSLGEPYRQVIFQETEGNKTGEILVFKKERPLLWEDIEKLERGGNIAPYKGYITRYNSIDLVVLGDESPESAFDRQLWKLNGKGKLTYIEAEEKRLESLGYRTNLTPDLAMEIGWRPIDSEAVLVKFRFYNKNGQFIWTNWYEIIKND
jgi:hypothetical protein